MTKDEADFLLHHLKDYLAAEGFIWVAQEIEYAQIKIHYLTAEQCKEYSKFVLPPGKRGRIKLVLSTPYLARSYALLYGILQSIEE